MLRVGKIVCGDVLRVLSGVPDNVIDCCVTSPPYWGLRDYGTAKWEGGDADCDHLGRPLASPKSRLRNDGRLHVGLYANEKKVVARMPFLDVCPKCGARRVDEQIGLEKTPEAYVAKFIEIFREVRRVLKQQGTLWLNLGDCYAGTGKSGGGKQGKGWENHGAASDEGKGTWKPPPCGLKIKDLVGIPWRVAFALQADGWWLRSDIIWHKPNPMPESIRDRPTRAHEYIFLLAKSKRYYYDSVAVQEPLAAKSRERYKYAFGGKKNRQLKATDKPTACVGRRVPTKGRNRRDVWTINTKPYKGAHFAVFPEALIEPCILAGCQERGIVLDPFIGSGTTALVAAKNGRRFVGIDVNSDYVELAQRRLMDAGYMCDNAKRGHRRLQTGTRE